ncbi:hypothetical protein NQ318_022006 [Aromia moschata]|uniref:DUF4817 domain-containing protein n=1 Tax=Aromia moschata TaxID=1265417 RepID=A0AAV8Z816_9CUCU|nr:hypothetical protein NQ318_022006 [Aromia moschata]
MIGVGDRMRTQQEVCRLFHEMHPDREPVSQSTVSRIERKYRELGHVRMHQGKVDLKLMKMFNKTCIEAYFNRYPERRQPNMSIFGRLKKTSLNTEDLINQDQKIIVFKMLRMLP